MFVQIRSEYNPNAVRTRSEYAQAANPDTAHAQQLHPNPKITKFSASVTNPRTKSVTINHNLHNRIKHAQNRTKTQRDRTKTRNKKTCTSYTAAVINQNPATHTQQERRIAQRKYTAGNTHGP